LEKTADVAIPSCGLAVDQRRFSDSSIYIKDLKKVYDAETRSSKEICLYDHPAIQELKKGKAARFRVYLTRLEPRITIFKDEKLTDPLLVSGDLAEHTIAQTEAGPGLEPKLTEALLFDASAIGQLMCLGVGRFAHNMLRPFMGDDCENYYMNPDELDPAAVCGQISRDHGLIFLDENAKIFFRDFGTKKDGERKGSKNGTWVNGVQKIQDIVIPWNEGDYLGVGGRSWVRRDGELVKEHIFKLRYERVTNEGPDKPGEKK
jgi:hypothetical protein